METRAPAVQAALADEGATETLAKGALQRFDSAFLDC